MYDLQLKLKNKDDEVERLEAEKSKLSVEIAHLVEKYHLKSKQNG